MYSIFVIAFTPYICSTSWNCSLICSKLVNFLTDHWTHLLLTNQTSLYYCVPLIMIDLWISSWVCLYFLLQRWFMHHQNCLSAGWAATPPHPTPPQHFSDDVSSLSSQFTSRIRKVLKSHSELWLSSPVSLKKGDTVRWKADCIARLSEWWEGGEEER